MLILEDVFRKGTPSLSFMCGWLGMFVFSGVSLLAMSVLGAMAIRQIRRSDGKLYGLRLALLEAMFCPAIARYCAAFGVLALVIMALPKPENARMALFPPLFGMMVIAVIIAVVIIYWRLWKRFKSPPSDSRVIKAVESPSAAQQRSGASHVGEIGRVSLFTSIGGLVVPAILALIGSVVDGAARPGEAYFVLCGALALVLELAALGCGIVARKTASGKAGLVVSIVSFTLAAIIFGYFYRTPDRRSTSDQSEVHDEMTAPAVSAPSTVESGDKRTMQELPPKTFEQTGRFDAGLGEEGVVYFPVPYSSPPNVELQNVFGVLSIHDCTAKCFKWRNGGSSHLGGVTWIAKGVLGTADHSEAAAPAPLQGTPAAPRVEPHGLHPGKKVSPTSAELAHVLAELPKEFTKGLEGDDEQRIMDLDTRVFAIDFDDGPADFWVQVKETGPQTFPDRLPTLNTGRARRIPASKAHILMWIQPRHSESMSAKLQTALYSVPPGFSLGIDVDGKPEMRVNHDVPLSEVSPLIPSPLWSVGGASDMRAGDAGFDAEMASQAILYIGRKTTINGGVAATCQLGLMYRPDRQTKGSDR